MGAFRIELKISDFGRMDMAMAAHNLWPTGIGFWIELGYEMASHRSRPEPEYSDARGGRHITLTIARYELHLIVRRLSRRPMVMVAIYAAKREAANY